METIYCHILRVFQEFWPINTLYVWILFFSFPASFLEKGVNEKFWEKSQVFLSLNLNLVFLISSLIFREGCQWKIQEKIPDVSPTELHQSIKSFDQFRALGVPKSRTYLTNSKVIRIVFRTFWTWFLEQRMDQKFWKKSQMFLLVVSIDGVSFKIHYRNHNKWKNDNETTKTPNLRTGKNHIPEVIWKIRRLGVVSVSYTHLTLPTIYSV